MRADLTGVDLKVGIDASSDSVGGEGFTNFGDVQFMQDAGIERYLEAASKLAPIDRGVFLAHYPGYVHIRIMQAMGAYGYRVSTGRVYVYTGSADGLSATAATASLRDPATAATASLPDPTTAAASGGAAAGARRDLRAGEPGACERAVGQRATARFFVSAVPA